ncbi:GGDEF domain-containing protein [Aquibaculum arenosum]|uniref:diguanylate cyclase n=1 Tax=Aquibaculum arenosum TaxID=3032591 RepID=A0ABT5YNJ0_9PROT|nr:GGDEF domain-containing protein [Fodinicurvata sp. CAU 1616]MDF2096371.1 GGDEF domain-containing protein [Fodinicurvata sp. CAU 1616]
MSNKRKQTDEKPDGFTLFDAEERLILESEEMVEMLHRAADRLEWMSKVVRQSLREQRRLIRLSDRSQLELQVANRSLADQAKELTRLNTALQQEIVRGEELTEELRRQATVDMLTGTASRRHFFTLAERDLRNAQRFSETLAVLLIDLDHFKEINDRHGHAVGDEVLKHFGQVCNEVFRNIDTVGRLGGEEFAVLLPRTNAAAAEIVAARFLRHLSDSHVPLDDGTSLHYQASVGIAECHPEDDTIERALARADTALYLAKQSGRNCYRLYTEETDEPSAGLRRSI